MAITDVCVCVCARMCTCVCGCEMCDRWKEARHEWTGMLDLLCLRGTGHPLHSLRQLQGQLSPPRLCQRALVSMPVCTNTSGDVWSHWDNFKTNADVFKTWNKTDKTERFLSGITFKVKEWRNDVFHSALLISDLHIFRMPLGRGLMKICMAMDLTEIQQFAFFPSVLYPLKHSSLFSSPLFLSSILFFNVLVAVHFLSLCFW